MLTSPQSAIRSDLAVLLIDQWGVDYLSLLLRRRHRNNLSPISIVSRDLFAREHCSIGRA
jgi:hypothetical protein